MRCRLLVLLFGFLAVASPSIAQKGRHAGSGRSHRDRSHQPTVSQPNVTKPPATPAAPKHHGTIKRSNAVTAAFMKPAGHPHGWPGHVVDHLTPPPAADPPDGGDPVLVSATRFTERSPRETDSRAT